MSLLLHNICDFTDHLLNKEYIHLQKHKNSINKNNNLYLNVIYV